MRKVFKENNFEIAWGNDHALGLFIQVFDTLKEEDEELIMDLDQGRLFGFPSFGQEILTRTKMLEVLSQYSENAKKKYIEFEEQELDFPLKGYTILDDDKGTYDKYDNLLTFKDYQVFLEKAIIQKQAILITDFMDTIQWTNSKFYKRKLA